MSDHDGWDDPPAGQTEAETRAQEDKFWQPADGVVVVYRAPRPGEPSGPPTPPSGPPPGPSVTPPLDLAHRPSVERLRRLLPVDLATDEKGPYGKAPHAHDTAALGHRVAAAAHASGTPSAGADSKDALRASHAAARATRAGLADEYVTAAINHAQDAVHDPATAAAWHREAALAHAAAASRLRSGAPRRAKVSTGDASLLRSDEDEDEDDR